MADDDPITRRARECAELLEAIAADRSRLASLDRELRKRLLVAAGVVSKPTRDERRQLAKVMRKRDRRGRRDADERVLSATGLRQLQAAPVYVPPALGPGAREPGGAPDETFPETLREPRKCYVCKDEYTRVHRFYFSMCPACAALNWDKRHQTADLRGRVALVTGARVKIGYQAALMLLRAGAHVIVATRFPRDAAARYAREPDFGEWGRRVEIHGVDLRHTPSVEALCRHLLGTKDRLDFVLHNACQTVRRPPGYYAHLMEAEHAPHAALPAETRRALLAFGVADGVAGSAALSQLRLAPGDDETGGHLFPAGALDADLQQVDLRTVNSWRLGLAEVPTVELLEVFLVNAVAPFVMNARLKPLMLAVPTRDKHVVNVSAMEGQFYRSFKTDKHPHTNMAKAALNMMTRTSAQDYVRDGIHMNSVDTGWVTDEDPVAIAARKVDEHGFHPPLDVVDGAARICDPIFSGLSTGEHAWGKFFKDYRPTDW